MLTKILSKLYLRYSNQNPGWPKASRMSYEGLFIEKGGVTLDIPLCGSSPTLMTLHLLYGYCIQLSTLDLHLKIRYITMHMYPCETKWLEQAMLDITMTQTTIGRSTLWHPRNDKQWWTYAKLGSLWWCPCTLWWHPSGSKLLPPLHLCTLIWLIYPNRLITFTSYSWVQPDHQHINA